MDLVEIAKREALAFNIDILLGRHVNIFTFEDSFVSGQRCSTGNYGIETYEVNSIRQ
jgi:hypothetical protein